MCVETMDAGSKRVQTDYQRKASKPRSKPRWRQLRVTAEDEAHPASAVRSAARKPLRREQRHTQLAKLARILGDMGQDGNGEAAYEGIPAGACMRGHRPGAMAPENTTQYLMGNVYEDMKANGVQTVPVSCETSARAYVESLSPSSVYAALDAGYESGLGFQQRDFEEAFDPCW